MKSLFAFVRKEFLEQIRSTRLFIVGALFILFGIMNPAIAKLTPWLLKTLSDSLTETGIIVTDVNVTALDSWVQFFKNMPIGLIAFILLQSTVFTKEYQSGTLVLSLTKGLERYKVVLSKFFALLLLWTLGYFLCFGITYAYNAYFWDNSIAQSLLLSVISWWLFGIFTLSLLTLFSTLSVSSVGVLIGTGAVILASYLIGLLPKIGKYMPTSLTSGSALIYGGSDAKSYTASIAITAVASLLCIALSIPVFNKKQL
ncbi:MAG: ABC transporter permease [Ruminococcaceae bacterium]|nr:ABC transporter permease [Oscillospiraceae bacterium]